MPVAYDSSRQSQAKSAAVQQVAAPPEKRNRPDDVVPPENKLENKVDAKADPKAGTPAGGAGAPVVQKKDDPAATTPDATTTTPVTPAAEAADKGAATTPVAGATDQAATTPAAGKTDGDKDGKKEGGPPPKEVVDEKEAERRKMVQAKWEGLLGKWLGGTLSKVVLENCSLDAMNGYVQEGLKAAGPALGGVLKGQLKPDAKQEAGLKEFSTALSGVMTGLVDKWMATPAGQKLLKGLSNWVEENPGWVLSIVGTALIGGGIAAWFSNVDLPNIEIPLSLGKGWELKAGVDFGKIQEMGFQGASLVVANKNQDIKLKAGVKHDDKDGEKSTSGSLEAQVGKDDGQHAAFVMNGKVTEGKDGLVAHTLGGKLELVDPSTGMKVTIAEDGSWDTKGNKKDAFSYQVKAGKEDALNGSFNCKLSNATVVDQDGNIVNISSRELGVAIGTKGVKFSASTKTDSKDGKETTTTSIGAEAEGQLIPGTLMKGAANVEIGENQTTLKLNGKMSAEFGGKKVELEGSYQQDGPIKGTITVGTGGQTVQITGEKKGDTITFGTKQLFGDGNSLEQSQTTDEKTGKTSETTTATAKVGGGTMTAKGGTDGSSVAYENADVGKSGVGVKGQVGADASGKTSASVGVKYTSDMVKAHLDAEMVAGKGSVSAGIDVKSKEGYKASAEIKVDDTRLKAVAISLGYQDPEEFKGFLLNYKRTWVEENQQYADHVDALIEYCIGKWYMRVAGGLDIQGQKIQKGTFDASLGYKLTPDWMLVGGVQGMGQRGQDDNFGLGSVKPYLGVQYKDVGVGAYYDPVNQGGGVMFTIPLGRSKK